MQFSMSRLTLFILACASVTFTLASPELVNIEKRTTGKGTHYPIPQTSDCGIESSSSDFVIEIGAPRYNSNGGADCGRKVHIEHEGKSASAKVVGSCPTSGFNDIVMSAVLFEKLAPLSEDSITVTWDFI